MRKPQDWPAGLSFAKRPVPAAAWDGKTRYVVSDGFGDQIAHITRDGATSWSWHGTLRQHPLLKPEHRSGPPLRTLAEALSQIAAVWRYAYTGREKA